MIASGILVFYAIDSVLPCYSYGDLNQILSL